MVHTMHVTYDVTEDLFEKRNWKHNWEQRSRFRLGQYSMWFR